MTQLPLKWADEEMIKRASSMHPFDLQGRMEIAVNALTAPVDPFWNYITYFGVDFRTKPVHMRHSAPGDFGDTAGRNSDALFLIRSATETQMNDEIVPKIAQNMIDFVDEGISWIPKGTPWARENRWSHLPEGSRTMLGLVTYFLATGDERAKKVMEEMVTRHYKLACKNEDYFWLVDMNYEEVAGDLVPRHILSGETLDETNPMNGLRSTTMGDNNRPATSTGMFFLPMMRFYEVTGDERASEFVRKAGKLIVDKMPDFSEHINHTHFNMATVSGILKCGATMNIPEFLQWGEKVYRQFVAQDYIPDFGWTPETATRLRKKDSLGCEACGTTDYIEVAILLARYVNGKYWDDVERIGMNQLLEGQMLQIDFQEKMPKEAMVPLGRIDTKMNTSECVLERCLGGFAGWEGPNDFIQMSANPGLMLFYHPKVEDYYFNFGLLSASTRIRIDFPDKTTTKREKIGEVEFITIWRGNAVIDMQPPGRIYPLYQNRNRIDAVIPHSYRKARSSVRKAEIPKEDINPL